MEWTGGAGERVGRASGWGVNNSFYGTARDRQTCLKNVKVDYE